MFVLDRLLVGGLRFVLDSIRDIAENESAESESSLHDELLRAQMQLELGEIDDEEFAEIESRVFERLRELRGEGPAQALTFASGVGVEVSYAGDERDAADDEKGRSARGANHV